MSNNVSGITSVKKIRPLSDTDRVAAILGAADGLGLAISLIAGRNAGLFHALLDDGIGELVSMGAAVYLSAKKRELIPAVLCGLATCLACVLPGIPYLVSSGVVAVISAGVIAFGLATVVCRLRPEKGWIAMVETYGVISTAGIICFAASLLYH